MVECTGLENRRGFKTFEGSNPSPSAKTAIKTPNANRSGSLSFRGFEDTPPFRTPLQAPSEVWEKMWEEPTPETY